MIPPSIQGYLSILYSWNRLPLDRIAGPSVRDAWHEVCANDSSRKLGDGTCYKAHLELHTDRNDRSAEVMTYAMRRPRRGLTTNSTYYLKIFGNLDWNVSFYGN